MLLGKDFGRCHYAGLIAVVHRNESQQDGYQSLAASHVSLKETVHLLSAAHIFPHFLDDTLLCASKRVWQRLVAAVEIIADPVHHDSAALAQTGVFLLQKAELKVEKFLELESSLCLFKGLVIRWKMYVSQSFFKRAEPLAFYKVFRQGFLYVAADLFQKDAFNFGDGFDSETAAFHPFCSRIDAGH